MKNKVNFNELNKIVNEIQNENNERHEIGIEKCIKNITNDGKSFTFKKINPSKIIGEINENI